MNEMLSLILGLLYYSTIVLSVKVYAYNKDLDEINTDFKAIREEIEQLTSGLSNFEGMLHEPKSETESNEVII